MVDVVPILIFRSRSIVAGSMTAIRRPLVAKTEPPTAAKAIELTASLPINRTLGEMVSHRPPNPKI